MFRQHQNQLVYFRLNNPYNGEMYYADYVTHPDILGENNILCGAKDPSRIVKTNNSRGASLSPTVTSIDTICTDEGGRYKILGPGESLNIPLEFRYIVSSNPEDYIEKTVSFDIWTSLFGDPINYTITFRANYIDSISDITGDQTASGISYTPTITGR